MALEQTYFLGAVEGDSDIDYQAREMRIVADAAFYAEGVCGIGHFAVTQRAGGANQSVDIAAGLAVVTADVGSLQGKYLQRNNAAVNFTGIPNAPGSGTRRHILCLRISDKQAGGSGYTPDFFLVQDTTGGGGLPPVPGNCLALAEVQRIAGQASVLTAHIKPMRMLAASVPAVVGNFEFFGTGSGQAIARSTIVPYHPSGLRPPTMGCSVADVHVAAVTNLLPGKWRLEAGMAVNGVTAGVRLVSIAVTYPDASVRKVTGSGPLGSALTGTSSMHTGRTFIVPSGCSAAVTMWQEATASTNLNGEGEAYFTGHWLGPVPGYF